MRALLHPSAPLLAACLAVALAAAGAASGGDPTPPVPSEVRALWVARTSLTSPRAVAEMVESARGAGFNTLLVQVRGRGDAYFVEGMEPRAAALASQPESFDPLAHVLALARPKKLRVHAWITVNLVSSASDLPASREHVVYRHPEWLMVPREIARDMSLLNPKSVLYLDKLARWIRSQPTEVEGLYLSPIPPGSADRTVQVIADLVTRYPIDGLHLDYIRYPNAEFDYSRESLEAFRDDRLEKLDARERARRERAAGKDLVAWAEADPAEWQAFRHARLTRLVSRIAASLRARRPGALLSAAVYPDPDRAAEERLQDWGGWVDRRLLDVVCPMAYATDTGAFTTQISAARRGARDFPVWAGIGAYRLSSEQTVENIRIARRLGASGVVLFSYDSLVSSPQGPGYLSQVSRAVFDR